jgi:hypothetical protein
MAAPLSREQLERLKAKWAAKRRAYMTSPHKKIVKIDPETYDGY